MTGLQAEILKIDFNYKIAKKIRVWQGRGGISFKPYKALMTVQNEDRLTVFWKPMEAPESISEVESDLLLLSKRLAKNAGASECMCGEGYLDMSTTAVTYLLPCELSFRMQQSSWIICTWIALWATC
jgi:hypothetical protein